MRSSRSASISLPEDDGIRRFLRRNLSGLIGLSLLALSAAFAAALATWTVDDPSLSHATSSLPHNALGRPGAMVADIAMQFLGLASLTAIVPPAAWGWQLLFGGAARWSKRAAVAWLTGLVVACGAVAMLPVPKSWPLPTGLGGLAGDLIIRFPALLLSGLPSFLSSAVLVLAFGALSVGLLFYAAGLRRGPAAAAPAEAKARGRAKPVVEEDVSEDGEDDGPGRFAVVFGALMHLGYSAGAIGRRLLVAGFAAGKHAVARLDRDEDEGIDRFQRRIEPSIDGSGNAEPSEPVLRAPLTAGVDADDEEDDGDIGDEPPQPKKARVSTPAAKPRPSKRVEREAQSSLLPAEEFTLPALHFLAEPKNLGGKALSADALEQNARLLEGVLDDFGVRGEIIHVRPGPVVTLYELEPAPGIKSSRVIGLADDIARSMSSIACRVAVIPGKNAIGIELPNARREMVFLRELLAAEDFDKTKAKLPLCLGKTIGGEPVIADLARMPHLLIAGTTGSGKSVAVNTMILSLLYRLAPEQCRLIMIDPKMLELSTYEGIPHLLTPVVTDPKKAIVALKWTVREMEDRYRKMSKLGVRNIDGMNQRIALARAKGEAIVRTVQTGFDRETGQAIYEQEELSLDPMPYIVVIIDEMADLMMVAGKDIEGAVQRLAQMARAAGIHVVMATQRPSVDVITGTIKANFPTRISFQVTSKIDSRTILGEQGAEQLLGQGDMLYMMGGGRIQRVHGPFVSDEEVDKVVSHLKQQGTPAYLESITEDEGEDGPAALEGGGIDGEESNDLYDQAVAVVLRDRKASTSYVQRRLQIGYNRAASIIERMEKEGLVGPANHAGKREILVEPAEERF